MKELHGIPKIENFDFVSIDDVKFIFYQAEKRLDDILKIGDNINAKTYTVISIITALLIGLLGTLVSKISKNEFDAISLTTFIGSIYLLLMLKHAIKNILPFNYQSLGTQPNEMVKNDFFVEEFPKELRTIYLYYAEIEDYQYRIDTNREINSKRWETLTKTINYLFAFPLLLGFLYLIISWLW
jgi:hypothetical protein